MSKSIKNTLRRHGLYAAVALILPAGAMAVDLSAGGQVPVIDIAAPNGAGVSHNQFDQFNVGAQGTVLNNSQNGVDSQLAGAIAGNANLAGGAAQVIIAEATGQTASQLNGALEIAGNKAALIVANPNGITANGASFINASRVTLTTGTPQLDDNGKLTALNVTKGAITVTGKGLDTTGVEMADLFARSIALNAELKASQLRVVTGSNAVSYNTNGNSIAYKKIAGEGEAPELALDVSALGSMYMDAIRMVGTENGVGVNVAGRIVSGRANALNMEVGGPIDIAGTIESGSAINLTSKGSAIHIARTGTVSGDAGVNLRVGTDVINEGVLKSTKSWGNITATSTGGSKARFVSSGTLASAGKATANGFALKKVSGTLTTADGIAGAGILHDDNGNTIHGGGEIDDGYDGPGTEPSVEEPKPVEPSTPVEEPKPVEPSTPVEEPKPVEPSTPVEEPKPVEKPRPSREEALNAFVQQLLNSIYSQLAYGFSPWGAPSYGYVQWNRPSYGYSSYGNSPWMPAYFQPQPVFSPWSPMASYGFNPPTWY